MPDTEPSLVNTALWRSISPSVIENVKNNRKEQILYSFSLSVCTDVCNSTDLPELEIISLLEEQLPVYKLRADTIFGYDQDDWLHTPLVDPNSALDLTTEQIEETLKYFCKLIIIFFSNDVSDVSVLEIAMLETLNTKLKAQSRSRKLAL